VTATLSIDTIRSRAAKFAEKYAGVTSEKQRDQDFMRDFCDLFGISASRIEWQYKVKTGRTTNWIDGFLPRLMLMEIKSAGEDLDKAYTQAAGYISQLKDNELPETVLVSDFARLHVYRRATGERIACDLCDLPQKIDHLKFLAGYESKAVEEEAKANERAAEKLASLHDAIKATGYHGKDLETYLVRLLFCLFAEDTGLFGENGCFLDLLVNETQADASDLHGELTALFDTLNRPMDSGKRPKNLPERLASFPYVNGALFKDTLAQCYFDEAARNTLIDCAKLDWSVITPSIFGSLFQAIMHFDDEGATAKTKKRREFGAHYTSEANILKVIRPLFLDGLTAEFNKIRRNKKQLQAFHEKLATLNFFDPACGCGNFLVIAYRELRLLELEVIEALWGHQLSGHLNVDTLIRCNVDQFHGIEIDESAAQIATVALWLTDHQMNLKVQRFGLYYNRIPLTKKANIVCANALQIDWAEVLQPERCSYVLGNPPFIGRQYQTEEQKRDLAKVFTTLSGAGVLDYVSAWYGKTAAYIKANPSIPVAFVSTNSICQGEHVNILWGYLLRQGINIHFAHRTFRWSNEGKGVAAVHCVIVGFGLSEAMQPTIFDYGDDISGIPVSVAARNINPYLVDAPSVLVEKRRKPIYECAPDMVFGNMPNDGGHLLLSLAEADIIRQTDPIAAKYIRPFLGGEEFINNLPRFCLWLKESTAQDRKESPEIQRRIKLVKAMRLASSRETTQKLADTPYLFGEIRQKSDSYLAIPEVSSERRAYLPIAFLSGVVASNKLYMVAEATNYHFGILTSAMHMAWMRTVCGRLKSDYQYSAGIVYNNFPWPEINVGCASRTNPSQPSPDGAHSAPYNKRLIAIETAAQLILDERKAEDDRCAKQGQTCSLATLYAAGNMPQGLAKAHAALDKAVDNAYGYKGKPTDAERVAFLFKLYQGLVGK
jgi:hypothetical protein